MAQHDVDARLRKLEAAVVRLDGSGGAAARIQRLEDSVKELQAEVGGLRFGSTAAAKGAKAKAPDQVNGDVEHEDGQRALIPQTWLPQAWVPLAGDGAAGGQGDEEEEEKDWEEYEFQPTIWDVVTFVGMPAMGKVGSTFVCFLALLTIAMQVVFCALISETVVDATVSQAVLHEIRDWRVMYAHDVRYADDISKKSMARQVCGKASADFVIYSAGQASLLQSVRGYLGDESPYPFLRNVVGPLMCIIALLVWYMTLLKDSVPLRSLAKAIVLVPHGGSTHIAFNGDEMTLERISACRRCFLIALVGLRVMLHLALFWWGSFFLVYSIDIQSLIVDAVALETVLTLDSLVYEAFVPHATKRLIHQLRPLKMTPWVNWHGMDKVSLGGFCCAATSAVLLLIFFILPQAAMMQSVLYEMCGGNLDFVSAVSRDGGVTIYPSENLPMTHTYAYQALREAIDAKDIDPLHGSPELFKYGLGISGSEMSVRGMAQVSIARATAISNHFCQDITMDNTASWRWALFLDTFDLDGGGNGSSGAASCSDPKVTKHCAQDTPRGVRSRQLCPAACGCSHPHSLLILTHPDEGCPPPCQHLDSYHRKLEGSSAFCVDDNSASSKPWKTYLQGVKELNISWVTAELSAALTHAYEVLLEAKCHFDSHEKDLGVDLCDEENAWHWKPLLHLCPKACKCHKTWRPGCPSVCNPDNH